MIGLWDPNGILSAPASAFRFPLFPWGALPAWVRGYTSTGVAVTGLYSCIRVTGFLVSSTPSSSALASMLSSALLGGVPSRVPSLARLPSPLLSIPFGGSPPFTLGSCLVSHHRPPGGPGVSPLHVPFFLRDQQPHGWLLGLLEATLASLPQHSPALPPPSQTVPTPCPLLGPLPCPGSNCPTTPGLHAGSSFFHTYALSLRDLITSMALNTVLMIMTSKFVSPALTS